MSSSNTTCALDPILMPIWLIKCCSVVLMPTAQLLTLSLLEGHVPAPWKNAVVKSMLKKSGIDPSFNLRFVAKIAGKAVLDQLMEYCTINHASSA